MLRFEWNSLRHGDAVLVHDDADLTSPLIAGVVRFVQVGRGAASNDVGIRLDGGGMARPRRAAVHLTPVDTSDCWRCDVRAGGGADQDVAGEPSSDGARG
jgi:hypothetical protein